jgi:hypothetical protein
VHLFEQERWRHSATTAATAAGRSLTAVSTAVTAAAATACKCWRHELLRASAVPYNIVSVVVPARFERSRSPSAMSGHY